MLSCVCVCVQDLLVEVFTAELPGGAGEASEVQEPLGTAAAAAGPQQVNIQLDDDNLKVRREGATGHQQLLLQQLQQASTA